ncbi:MAG: KH domain-containing protein [Syntrophomonadaceae bacterium]|nr:KH domain-containing protein [Syntrophomonadaceae bacterium]
MQSIEKKGKSVDEAINSALDELGVDIEEVEIEILEEPIRGILGIIGNKSALVRVNVKEKPEKMAEKKLIALLDGMKIDYELEKIEVKDGLIRINITGKDMGLLIGRKGETLNAVQFILGLMVNRVAKEKVRVVLDVEDYRLRKEESLRSMAVNLSDKVKRTRRSVVMRPMSPHERRVIHTALQGDPEIVTFSQGEEPHRKVVISLKK